MSTHKEQLTEKLLTERLSIPTQRTNIKDMIRRIIGNEAPEDTDLSSSILDNQRGPRKYCSYCNSSKRRMTTTYCSKCGRPICGEHQKKMCKDC